MDTTLADRHALIRHPGPPAAERRRVVPGRARRAEVALPAGAVLMDAVAAAMDALGCDTAMLLLDGLQIGPYAYVMPRYGSPDGVRAAWYSETRTGARATLEHATATVGRRDGSWWLHCHAVWDADTPDPKSGHLLPDQVTIAADATVTAVAFDGGRFEVTPCDETLFPLFRPLPTQAPDGPANAAIVTFGPHEDAVAATRAVAAGLGFAAPALYGIGSLIGADFADAPSMEAPASEILLLPDATPERLRVHCVDPEGAMFRGTLLPGRAPVCVTFEMMIVAG
ncbi:DUF296 domain-containing protein [Amaricoccus sp.]|uniref:DUF296 domain-containing protein n=1 Tax=Amaricoccus sp. TaxID=1872485 RepID=UPI001B705DA9|nr:DUF296 domain-containing protein [Amaricoccus sp.]MBP7002639.1 DUF296 domain-containing protein [Amaricoccus sp.]